MADSTIRSETQLFIIFWFNMLLFTSSVFDFWSDIKLCMWSLKISTYLKCWFWRHRLVVLEDVKMHIWWCHNAHLMMSQCTFDDVKMHIWWCHNAHLMMSQCTFDDVTMHIWWCHNVHLMMSQCAFDDVTMQLYPLWEPLTYLSDLIWSLLWLWNSKEDALSISLTRALMNVKSSPKNIWIVLNSWTAGFMNKIWVNIQNILVFLST